MNIDKKRIKRITVTSPSSKTMQTSFSLVSNKRPSSGEAVSTAEGEFNRGIFKIDIPALSRIWRSPCRIIMYVSVDASGSMDETATRR